MKEENVNKVPNKLILSLNFIMFCKVFGFLALSESAGVNKVFKVAIGLFMTLLIIMVTRSLIKKKYVFRFNYVNVLIVYFYLFYFLLGIISVSWAADYLFATIQIFRDLDLLLFAILFVRVIVAINYHHNTKYNLSHFLVYTIFFNALYFMLGSIFDPGKFMRLTHGGEVERLGGYIMNPNELGMLCSAGGACVLLQLKQSKNKLIMIILLGVNLYTMFLTGSRSSSIGFILVAGLYALLSDNKQLKVGVLTLMFIGAPIVLTKVVFSEEKGGVDEVMSMTGRLPFWKALLTEALPKEPLLGYGFMNIYYTKNFQGKNTYPASMTHNTFVQVVMNLGLVGALIVLFQMIFTFRAVIRTEDKEARNVFLLIFVPILINSLTEFGIWGETNYGVLFYQLLFIGFVVNKPTEYTNPVLNEGNEEFHNLEYQP